MAKVKIQGHASGTGVLTVTAPNTNTDRTISLPDSTDTLAVNSDVTNKLPLAGGTMTGALTINSGANLAFQANGTSYTQIWQTLQSPNDLTLKTTADKYISFQPNSTEKVRLHSSGVMSVSNGIELGSGLDATAANTLDDYEEGTWTVTSSDSASGFYQAAHYVKVGGIVHVRAYFGDIGGGITFAGLPFAAESSTGLTIHQMYQVNWPSSAKQLACYASGSNIYFRWQTDTGVGAALSSTDTAHSSCTFGIAGTYKTTA